MTTVPGHSIDVSVFDIASPSSVSVKFVINVQRIPSDSFLNSLLFSVRVLYRDGWYLAP